MRAFLYRHGNLRRANRSSGYGYREGGGWGLRGGLRTGSVVVPTLLGWDISEHWPNPATCHHAKSKELPWSLELTLFYPGLCISCSGNSHSVSVWYVSCSHKNWKVRKPIEQDLLGSLWHCGRRNKMSHLWSQTASVQREEWRIRTESGCCMLTHRALTPEAETSEEGLETLRHSQHSFLQELCS